MYCLLTSGIFLHNVHEGIWGGGWSIVPRIPKLGARWKRVVSISPRLLYPPAKYHSTHSTGGWVDLEQIWTFKRRENLLPLPGIEPRTAPFDVCRAVLKECEEKVAVINCILNRYISVHLRREPLDSSTAQCVLCIAKSHIWAQMPSLYRTFQAKNLHIQPRRGM